MQDKSTFLLAADSETEMEEWISTLNKILHSSFEQAMQEKRNEDLHDGLLWTSLTCCVLSGLVFVIDRSYKCSTGGIITTSELIKCSVGL